MQLSPLSQLIPSFGAPTLEDFDTSNLQEGARIGGNSNRQYVRFYKKPETKFVKGPDGKRMIVEQEREFVHIKTPGDTNEYDGHVQEFLKREHWRHYQAYRDGRVAPMGQPLEEAEFIGSAVASELRILGCHTVEQLADGSDHLCGQIPNGFELREFSRAMCKANKEKKSDDKVNVLTAALAQSNDVIREMQDKMRALEGMLYDSQGNQISRSSSESEVEKPKRKHTKKAETVTE